MKQNYFIRCLLSLVLLVTGTSAWAEEETVDFSQQGYTDTQKITSTSGVNVNVTFTNGSTATAYYNNGTAIRIYGGGSFTVSSATKKISKIAMVFSGTNAPGSNGALTVSSGTYDTASNTWTAESSVGVSDVSFSRASGSGHWRLQKIVVTFAADASKTPTTTAFEAGAQSTYDVGLTESFTAPKATVDSGGAVAYSSSNTSVATVDASTGDVTLVGAGTTTITASYAGDDTYGGSSASYTLNVFNSYADLQSANAAATSTATKSIITLTNAIVTGVNGSNAYISDGEFGLLIYSSGHGLNAGEVLNGKIVGDLTLYKGAPEIANIDLSNVTKTTGTLTASETTIDAISAANIGRYVLVKDLLYNQAASTFTNGTNSITYYNGLASSVTLVDGKVYNVTGVVGLFNNLQLLPVSVEEVINVMVPELTTATEPKTSLVVGTPDSYVVNYNGDGEVTVESSAAEVATATYDAVTKTVTITPLASGTTTITLGATAGATYSSPVPVTYNLVVANVGEETVVFSYNESGILGEGTQGNTVGGFSVTKGNATLDFDNAYGNTSYLQVYGSSQIKVSAAEGYIVKSVNLNATTAAYLKTWKDQDGADVAVSDNEATWTGALPYMSLVNQSSSQARLYTITVNLQKLDEVGTVTITAAGKGTYAPTQNVVVGDGTVTKYITGTASNGTTLVEADAEVVKSGEGVLLSGTPGEYKVYSHSLLSPAGNADNKLVGCASDTSVPTGSYVLQNLNEKTAFYLVAAEAPITCPAGKAYLKLASGAKALYFYGDDATAIDGIAGNAQADAQEVYTIGGVKVDAGKLTKGVYVVNGRKVIVK